MNKFKLVLSIIFLVLGLACVTLIFAHSYSGGRGSGITEYKDGIAIGLGIISGFSFLSSVLLLNRLKD